MLNCSLEPLNSQSTLLLFLSDIKTFEKRFSLFSSQVSSTSPNVHSLKDTFHVSITLHIIYRRSLRRYNCSSRFPGFISFFLMKKSRTTAQNSIKIYPSHLHGKELSSPLATLSTERICLSYNGTSHSDSNCC